MITIVARVLRILSGHSAAAQVQLLDEHGHEHKLELPFELAQRIEPGSLMVLQWSLHAVPGEVALTGPAPEVPLRPGSSAGPARPPAQVVEAVPITVPRPVERPSNAAGPLTPGSTTNAGAGATAPPEPAGALSAAERWISDLFRSK